MEGDPPPVEERRRLQEELSEFVESCCRRLEEVTASLGWSLDGLEPGKEDASEVSGAGPLGALGLRSSLAVEESTLGPRREGRGSPRPGAELLWAPRTGWECP